MRLFLILLSCFFISFGLPAQAKNTKNHTSTKNHTATKSHTTARPAPSMPITGEPKPSMQPVEQSLISLMRQWKLPGGSLAVVKNGKVVYARGFGWANIEHKIPVEPSSLFRIASVSKLFTATTILKLAQNGQLNLDQSVFHILDDLKPIGNRSINPSVYNITVRNLLNMSSGWFSPGSAHVDPMFGPWPRSYYDLLSELPASCEETARMMAGTKLRHKPGSLFVYSNLDYCMLGLLVDKVTENPYDYLGYQNYVNTQILAPLGIHNMFIGNTEPKAKAANEVTYYGSTAPVNEEDSINTPYLPYSNTEILKKNFSDGGWVATASDLAKFMYALGNRQILTEKSLETMQARPPYSGGAKDNYFTMGMKVYHIGNQIYWIQTGSFTGTNAMVVKKPNGTAIAVIFNTRPATYGFFTKFRPQLRGFMLSERLERAIEEL